MYKCYVLYMHFSDISGNLLFNDQKNREILRSNL